MPQLEIGSSAIAFASLMDGSTPLTWNEAVALVHQVGRTFAERPDLGVPSVAGLSLGSDGTVRVETPGRADTPGATRPGVAGVAPALADLLKTLLPASAPDELTALAAAGSTGVGDSDLQQFLTALTFFARPDEIGELKVLASRAASAREADARAAALHSITERARQAPASSSSEPTAVRKPLRVRRFAFIGAAVAALALTVSSAYFLTRRASASGTAQASLPEAAREVAQGVQSTIASAAAFVRESIEGVPDVPAGRGADMKLPAPRSRPKPRLPETAVALVPPQMTAVDAPVPDAVVAGGGVPPVRELPSNDGASHALAAAPHGVYGATFPDVIPPALLRAQMPATPIGGVPLTSRPGALELVVGEDGRVLSAKLVPTSTRYQDRMMVSAAKAWRFAPATRNGQAVTYRLQMPITW